jgi:hypothetical protein
MLRNPSFALCLERRDTVEKLEIRKRQIFRAKSKRSKSGAGFTATRHQRVPRGERKNLATPSANNHYRACTA